MKVAVVGCGGVSANHFEALGRLEDVEITAVVDIKKDRADEKAALTGAKAYYDFDEMLENEKPDCIHIATPHYLHTRMAVKALRAGINVFLEKPCSVSFAETEELAKAQLESGRQLGICFQNRYNNCVKLAKEIIGSREYGRVRAARAFITWDRGVDYYSDDWHGRADKECGGVLINQAIHTVDLVQYLCGECRAVTAHVFNDRLKGIIEVEDTAALRMELEDGVTAMLYATNAFSMNSPVFIEITLENAVLRIEGERLFRCAHGDEFEMICDKSGKEFAGKDYWGHGHNAIIKDFYDCLKTGREFTIDAIEGAKAAKIVLSSYVSSEKNERVEVN
ncbi:MAG: Gfo/Idh/MocA family oxidoreductase [Clostridia bacterium]|nr:Gfo/Idh/MocA family oxidoreductase [Clostridia bacterium]